MTFMGFPNRFSHRRTSKSDTHPCGGSPSAYTSSTMQNSSLISGSQVVKKESTKSSILAHILPTSSPLIGESSDAGTRIRLPDLYKMLQQKEVLDKLMKGRNMHEKVGVIAELIYEKFLALRCCKICSAGLDHNKFYLIFW